MPAILSDIREYLKSRNTDVHLIVLLMTFFLLRVVDLGYFQELKNVSNLSSTLQQF